MFNRHVRFFDPCPFGALVALLCLLLSGSANSAPKIDLTPAQQAWLDAHPRIVLGASDQMPPGVMRDPDGRLTGHLMDYLDLINQRLGSDIQVHAEPDWAEVTRQATAGEIDGMLAVAARPFWRERFLLSEPLLTTQTYLFARDGERPAGNRLGDLHGRRVGILRGHKQAHGLVDRQGGQIAVVDYDSYQAMAAALLAGEVDLLVADGTFDWWRRENTLIGFGLARILEGGEYEVVSAVRQDWPELVELLNLALASISTAEREALRQRWLGSLDAQETPAEADQPSPLNLTAAEQAWLEAHPRIRFAVTRDWAPIGFYDRDDQPAGIAPDYLARIAEMLGGDFEPVPISDWPEAMAGLAEGRIDLLPAMTPTKERQRRFRFTTPYLDFPVAIFARVETPLIDRLDALAGQRVIIIDGYAVQEWLQRDHPDIHLVRVRDAQTAVRALADGQGDALVGNLFAISQAVAHAKLFQIRVAGETPYSYRLAMATRPDWAPLIGILDQALDAIPSAERDAIQSRWLRESVRSPLDSGLIWRLVVAAAAILALVLLWNLSLRRQVQRRRRAERVLAESEQRYRSMVESAGPWFHFYALGPDGTLLDSTSSEALFEIEAERLLGMNWSDIADWTPETRVRGQETVMRCLRGEVPPPVTLDYSLNGRPRYLISYPRPVRDDTGRVTRIEGITVDLTEQRALEAELREAKHRAEAASRAKSDFLANMSHEIRTPMNAILGMLHLALQVDLDERLRDYLEKAQGAARNLLGLLNDILDLSKVEANQLRLEQAPFSLGEVLDNLATVIGQRARDKGLALHIERPDDLPDQLMGDPLRLSQILTNLAGNAVKFTEQGEVRIAVRAASVEAGQPRSSDQPKPAGHEGQVALEFVVSDTGIGMDAAMVERLFQPFQQADSSTTRRYGGTGLGLSICKRLLDLMHGTIEVSSTPGVGTRFTVRLDFARATEPTTAMVRAAAPEAAPQVNLSGRRVLVVEDNEVNREVARALLEREGVAVRMAEDGLEAVACLEADGCESVDLVLMDVQMPNLDGYGATACIRDLPGGDRLPIIGVTAHARPEDIARVREAGMNAYISKPIDAWRLAATMAEQLSGEGAPELAGESAPESAEPPTTDPSTAPPAAEEPSGSPQDLTALLDTLAAKAARHDASIEDDFRAARQLLGATLTPADYRALADAIGSYRFAAARQLIARWRQMPPDP